MSAAEILRETAAAGVTLSLSSTGTIKAAGNHAAMALWLRAIREHKTGILALLAEGANVEPGRQLPDTLLAGDQEAAVGLAVGDRRNRRNDHCRRVDPVQAG